MYNLTHNRNNAGAVAHAKSYGGRSRLPHEIFSETDTLYLRQHDLARSICFFLMVFFEI